jgi:hypothetical protein
MELKRQEAPLSATELHIQATRCHGGSAGIRYYLLSSAVLLALFST